MSGQMAKVATQPCKSAPAFLHDYLHLHQQLFLYSGWFKASAIPGKFR
jgi:hypothetical protein